MHLLHYDFICRLKNISLLMYFLIERAKNRVYTFYFRVEVGFKCSTQCAYIGKRLVLG